MKTPFSIDALFDVRRATERIVLPLEVEDFVVQTIPDVSPPKWHLAHTTWFFEHFVLRRLEENFKPHHEQYGFLFNSYYDAVGARTDRSQRGTQARPTVRDVLAYRHAVDERLSRALGSREVTDRLHFALVLGMHHEQQHQELLLTDIKHIFGSSPLLPAYRALPTLVSGSTPNLRWTAFEGGIRAVGTSQESFAFDNERPQHRVIVESFEMANRLVTAGEFKEFIHAGGYDDPRWWLSDGWAVRNREGWSHPLYWRRHGNNDWNVFTLDGGRPLNDAEPVCHVSFYEADAFARWSGARLPTEAEWEVAAGRVPLSGNFMGFTESTRLHPSPVTSDGLEQLFGDAWEWTQSAYLPYPGFAAFQGDFAEYNGKFMANQMVLRGGSCATPADHIRATYRNFFGPSARWQFTSLRLCRSARAATKEKK